MLRMRSAAAVAALALVLAVTGAGTPAMARQAVPGDPGHRHHVTLIAHVSPRAFRVVVSSHFGEPQNASGYSAIVVTGRREAWVFGGTNPGGPGVPVAERWNGVALVRSALPAGLGGFISDASAPSASDIWAASEYGGYVLHWNGTRWRIAMRPGGGLITGLTAISATDVWVFGAAAGGEGTGTWHFDGQSWRRVSGLAGAIYRASAISRHDIWAIAADPKSGSVLRYNGRRWRPVHTGGALAGVVTTDILATSPRDVWVLGDEVSSRTVRLVLAHWNGARWTRTTAAVRAFAGRLSPGSHGSVLVTATAARAAGAGLILQASAAGWRRATAIQSGLGSGVSAVAVFRGSGLLLASGGVLTRLGSNAVVWEGQLTPPAGRRAYDHT